MTLLHGSTKSPSLPSLALLLETRLACHASGDRGALAGPGSGCSLCVPLAPFRYRSPVHVWDLPMRSACWPPAQQRGYSEVLEVLLAVALGAGTLFSAVARAVTAHLCLNLLRLPLILCVEWAGGGDAVLPSPPPLLLGAKLTQQLAWVSSAASTLEENGVLVV